MVDQRSMKTNEITQPLHTTEPAFMTRIRLRARRRILWLNKLWASSLTEEVQGLAISHNEVDRILADPEQHASARQLSKRIHTIERWIVNEDPWLKLRGDFGLSTPEIDLLMLAVAVEVDPLLRRVYGYLQDNATASSPSAWLAASLFQWPPDVRFGPAAPLVRWHMAWPLEGSPSRWSVSAPWTADPHIVSWLNQGHGPDPVLDMAVQFIAPSQSTGKICLYPTQLTAMQAFVQAMRTIGYDGFISYELCHPVWVRGTRRRAGIEYVHEQAALALEYMRGLIAAEQRSR